MVAVLLLAACTAAGSDGSDVLRRAAADAPAEAWTFIDRPDAEQLLQCVAGFEAVRVSVDLTGRPRMSIGRPDGDEIAMWFEDASYVHGVAVGAPDIRWVRIDRADRSLTAQIETALGSSLAAWVLAEQPPPAPGAIVESALEFAAHVEVRAQRNPGSTTVEVTIDEQRTADVAGTDPAGYPTLSFLIADGALTTIAAHSATDPDSFGFRWEYQPTGLVVADEPTNSVDAGTIAITAPNQRGRTCEIGP